VMARPSAASGARKMAFIAVTSGKSGGTIPVVGLGLGQRGWGPAGGRVNFR
jgi:hypothetical protein